MVLSDYSHSAASDDFPAHLAGVEDSVVQNDLETFPWTFFFFFFSHGSFNTLQATLKVFQLRIAYYLFFFIHHLLIEYSWAWQNWRTPWVYSDKCFCKPSVNTWPPAIIATYTYPSLSHKSLQNIWISTPNINNKSKKKYFLYNIFFCLK